MAVLSQLAHSTARVLYAYVQTARVLHAYAKISFVNTLD